MESISSSYSVLLSPRAYRDLDDIYLYISSTLLEPTIAKQQIDHIWNAIYSLSSFPYSHQDRLVGKYANKGYKQLLVDNYIIIYQINEVNEKVVITTIQYIRRNL